MKKQILVILISILSISLTFEQQLKPNVITKAESESFVSELQPHVQDDKTSDIMVVYNSKSHYHNKIPRNRNPDITFTRGDKGRMLEAFTGVFTDERLKQLLPEKFLPMTLYLNTSGKILEVEFILNRNTPLKQTFGSRFDLKK
jgi:hypothetical protein